MLVTPLDDRYELTVHVRPVKHAYFLPAENSKILERVARLSCSQWGGIRNLLIPLDSDRSISTLFLQLIHQAEPDKFITFIPEGHSDVVNSLQVQLKAPFPDRQVSVRRGDSFEHLDHSVHALDSFRSPSDLVRSNPRDAQASTGRPRLTDVRLQAAFEDDWTSRIIYGGIYDDQDGNYREGMDVSVEVLAPGTDQFWESQLRNNPLSSVLNLTAVNIWPHKIVGGWTDSNHFDVFLVDNVSDACMYWTCRALRESLQFDKEAGRRTLLFPASLAEIPDVWDSLTRLFVRHTWRESGQASVDVVFYAREGLHDIIADALSKQGKYERASRGKISLGRKYPPQPIDYTDRNLSYALLDPSVSIFPTWFSEVVQEGAGRGFRQRANLHVGENHVEIDPSDEFFSRSMGEVAVDYECAVWSRFPSWFRVAEAIVPHAWFSRRGLTAIYRLPSQKAELRLNLPDEWESLRHFFIGKGYEIRLSQDGAYADAVANLLGGFNEVSILANRGVYDLLDILALRSSLKVAQRIGKRLGLTSDVTDQIADQLGEIETIPELKGRIRSIDALSSDQRFGGIGHSGVLEIVDRLVNSSLINRGYYLSCPACGSPDWYPLDILKEELMCTGCRSAFSLPVQYPPGREIQWQYRLNTLVNRAMDQDVVPNLLGLRAASQGRQTSCLATGVEVLRDGRPEREFDFIFVDQQKIYGGECKSGISLMKKDFDKAELAATLGFEGFYFCSLGDFEESALLGIEECKKRIHDAGCLLQIHILNGLHLFGETPVVIEGQ